MFCKKSHGKMCKNFELQPCLVLVYLVMKYDFQFAKAFCLS